MLKVSDWLLNTHEAPGFKKAEKVDTIRKGPLIHHTEYLYFKIPKRYALVNITPHLEEVLSRAQVWDGFCFVSTLHITAGIYINDAEEGLLQDIAQWIEKLAPYGENYRHHQTGEDNGDAHLKSYLTHPSIQVPITRGKLDLGTWQQIFYAEFDGQREKRILIKVTGIEP
jgi:secondary thiamine-phosphate synthase enzyme